MRDIAAEVRQVSSSSEPVSRSVWAPMVGVPVVEVGDVRMCVRLRVVVVRVRDSAVIIGLLAWLLYLNWRLTLIAAVLIPIVAVMVRAFSKRMRRLSSRGLCRSSPKKHAKSTPAPRLSSRCPWRTAPTGAVTEVGVVKRTCCGRSRPRSSPG
jgi:hypothetical protein